MTLSFLIPTRDRHAALARTLASVVPAARRCGAAIVVCDQSPTPAPASADVRVLHRPDIAGLPAARNALLRATDAGLVCFLDDDVDVAGDLGERLLAHAAAEPACLGWGPVIETRSSSVRRLHRLAQLGVFHDPRRLLSRRCDRSSRALFGCCFAVRHQVALRVGFDARRGGYALGEDLDFFLRLGGPLRFCADLRVVHRRDGGGRDDATRRGLRKGAFLVWLARRHGGRNPATLLHLGLATAAAASGRGDEPAAWRGVIAGLSRGA